MPRQLLFSLVLFFVACKHQKDSLPSAALSPCQINGVSSPEILCQTEDGLQLIGGFDENRASVIFIHGWIPSYEAGLPSFVNAEAWQNKGFNTFLFRFVKRSLDQGEAETCRVLGQNLPFTDVDNISCARVSEQRVWSLDGTGDFFLKEYTRFFQNYPLYRGEIRAVGHSLGGQIAAFGAYLVMKTKSPVLPQINRIELLDPWVGDPVIQSGIIEGPLSQGYPELAPVPQTRCEPSKKNWSFCALESSLWTLKQAGRAIVVYGSNAAGAFAFDLRKNFNYQAFHEAWLCSKTLIGNGAFCPIRTYSMFTAQHFFPLLSYFWSISQPAPENVFTASTPSAAIRASVRYQKLSDKGNFCQLPPSVVFWKRGQLQTVFGMSRYNGTIGDGTQSIPQDEGEFQERMIKFLGFSKQQAEQCAQAIAFRNDQLDTF